MDPNQVLGWLNAGSSAALSATDIAINLFNLVVGALSFL